MEQQIFRESTVKRILYYAVAIVFTFIFSTVLLSGEDWKTYYWALNIGVIIFCLFSLIFEKDTTIICDEIGCTVNKKKLWKTSGESYGFKWREVTATEYYADGETNREFFLEINGVQTKILTSGTSLDDFDYFIRTVNSATLHLPYFWEKGDGWVSNNFEGRRYKKVAR